MDYKSVKISEDAKIARQSVVIGDVTIGRDSCVLHYAVIRGDDAPIVIGEESNVQENCTIHVSRNMPVHIGNNVTVGHNAVLHGCMIGDRTLIGMGAVGLAICCNKNNIQPMVTHRHGDWLFINSTVKIRFRIKCIICFTSIWDSDLNLCFFIVIP